MCNSASAVANIYKYIPHYNLSMYFATCGFWKFSARIVSMVRRTGMRLRFDSAGGAEHLSL